MDGKKMGKFKIPDRPGVYFFMKGKEIVYIGKATSLRSRVKSYLSRDLIKTRGPLLVDMVFQADKINWQETDSILEAVIMEANFIKKYQPKYNTKEKDDKSFNHVVITKEKIPRVLVVRGKDLQKLSSISASFGPYTNGRQLQEALKIIRRIFPFFDDKSKNYYEFYRQVELVPDMASKEMALHYKNNIKYLKLFLQGKKKEVERGLKKEMMLMARARKFEQAGEIKRQLFALKHINDVALLKLESNAYILKSIFRIEAYDIAHMSGKNMVGVMTVVENGNVAKNEYRKFKIRKEDGANDTAALGEVLERRFTHPEWKMPDLVVMDGGRAQINLAKKVFKKLGIEIHLVAVVKDERHKPKAILGSAEYIKKYKVDILVANSEAHRFAINYHKNIRGKNFLPSTKLK